jgi:hypothetical protein
VKTGDKAVHTATPTKKGEPSDSLAKAPNGGGSEFHRLLDALPAGAYRVHWHVVSVDTHMTEGDFSFTVRP